MSSQIFTVNSLIKKNLISPEIKLFLHDYLLTYNQLKFKYTQQYQNNPLFGTFSRSQQKNSVDTENLLPYRVFHGIESTVKGLVASQITRKKDCVNELSLKIKAVEKQISALKTKIANTHKPVPASVSLLMIRELRDKSTKSFGYKAKRLNKLNQKLLVLKNELDNKYTKVLYGGSKLLRERHKIHNNDTVKLNRWKNAWTSARTNEMLFIGSTDEKMGNSNAHLVRDEQNNLLLRITIPLSMRQNAKYGFTETQVYVDFPIDFKYHKQMIENHLLVHENIHKNERKASGIKNSLAIKIKNSEKGLYVHASFEVLPQKVNTTKDYGVIGVDINPDHFAVAELDEHGNKVHAFKVPLDLIDKSSGQRKNVIFHGVKKIIEFAKLKGKSIVIEDLDFSKKRALLAKNENAKYALMLSSFSYSTMTYAFISSCFKKQIELIKVNPAFTSQLGNIKYSTLHGLTVHEAAAMMVGRRGMGFKEKLPKTVTRVTVKSLENTLCVERFEHVSSNFRYSIDGYFKTLNKKGAWKKLDGIVIPSRFQGLLSKLVSSLTTKFYFPFSLNDQVCIKFK